MSGVRYNPDDEIRKRALAEIAEIAEASRPRRLIDAYRSDTPRAQARRDLLRQLADESRDRVLGVARAGEDAGAP